eukprot:6452994-Prymnesium_polylepis.1
MCIRDRGASPARMCAEKARAPWCAARQCGWQGCVWTRPAQGWERSEHFPTESPACALTNPCACAPVS